jgi:hypothetical protein
MECDGYPQWLRSSGITAWDLPDRSSTQQRALRYQPILAARELLRLCVEGATRVLRPHAPRGRGITFVVPKARHRADRTLKLLTCFAIEARIATESIFRYGVEADHQITGKADRPYSGIAAGRWYRSQRAVRTLL